VSRAFVVVNPAAGGGRTRRLWPGIERGLRRSGLEIEWAETAGAGSATALARRAAADGWPLVVAVGGDGTVNEVVDGLADPAGRPLVAFGAIQTGRGRDAARNLGIPADRDAAIERLARGGDALVDLGVAEWRGAAPRCFVNSAGAGFDASVVRRAERIRGPGTLPYVAGILLALRRHAPASAAIHIDGHPAWTGFLTAAVVANGPFYGGGMKIAPDAAADDGLLDLVILGALGRAELLAWLPAVYRGAHLANAKVTTRRGREIAIETDPPVPVHLDGEAVATTPIRIGIRPAALRVRR